MDVRDQRIVHIGLRVEPPISLESRPLSVPLTIADQRQLSEYVIALLREKPRYSSLVFPIQPVYDLMRTPIDEQLLCPIGFIDTFDKRTFKNEEQYQLLDAFARFLVYGLMEQSADYVAHRQRLRSRAVLTDDSLSISFNGMQW